MPLPRVRGSCRVATEGARLANPRNPPTPKHALTLKQHHSLPTRHRTLRLIKHNLKRTGSPRVIRHIERLN